MGQSLVAPHDLVIVRGALPSPFDLPKGGIQRYLVDFGRPEFARSHR